MTNETPMSNYPDSLKSPLFKTTGFILAAILGIGLVFSMKGPLQDSHWDAPIYLSQSLQIASTSALQDYARHADVIAARLPDYRVETDAYTPYWAFMRLGHSVILSTAAWWTGGGLAGIQAAFWLYTLLWASGVVLSGLLAYRLVSRLTPSLPAWDTRMGAIAAVALYLASDICRHMSGNLVAEVPALFFLTAACYLFVLAHEHRSIVLAITSGTVGFSLYVTKMEAVWAYLVFLPIFVGALHGARSVPVWWPGLLTAIGTAATFYAIYAWHFWPLPDPRLLLIFAEAHEKQAANAVAPFKLWVVAGGLVWLGVFIALLRVRRGAALWLALGWLALITLPYLGGMLTGKPAQVRMYALILPALAVAATLGIGSLLRDARAHSNAKYKLMAWMTAAVALIALSTAEGYRWLRELPGGWRLQYIKAYLSPPPYERLDYPVDELANIGRMIYAGAARTLVYLGKNTPEEYFNIIQYFGPPPRRSNIARYATASAEPPMGMCGVREIRFEDSPVMYCIEPPDAQTRAALRSAGVRILRLQERVAGDNKTTATPKRARLSTPRLLLVEE